MPYNSNIPQATEFQDDSQLQILNNFTALASWGNGYGAFSLQGGAPTFIANTDYIYLLNDGGVTTSKDELWLHKQTTSGLSEVPFTASKMSDNAAASCDSGWSYLPSGLLIKWGTKPAAAPVSNPVSVDVATISGGPNFSRVFQAFLSPVNIGGVTDPTLTFWITTAPDHTTGAFQFRYQTGSGVSSVSYLLLGI